METPVVEHTLITTFEEFLPRNFPDIQFLELKLEARIKNFEADLVAKTRFNGETKTWLCEVRTKGEPRFVYEAVGKLASAKKIAPQAYPVILVPTLSEESKKICRQAEVGYVCLTGEYFLKYDSIFIERTLQGPSGMRPQTEMARRSHWRPPVKTEAILKEYGLQKRGRKYPFPFSPASARILRVFLENPKTSWTIARLAGEAKTAPRMANLVVNYLADKLLINKGRGNITLAKPKELLDLWSINYDFKKEHIYVPYYSLARNMDEFSAKLHSLPDGLKEQYALTLYAGANLIAPYTRFGEYHLYIDGDTRSWVDALGLSPAETGANVFLVMPHDQFVFYKKQMVGDVSVVSNIQLYLDLYNYNERARDHAQVLYKQAISF